MILCITNVISESSDELNKQVRFQLAAQNNSLPTASSQQPLQSNMTLCWRSKWLG